MKYRTIVADPPWPIGDFPANLHERGKGLTPCPYPTMEVEAIADLGIADMAERDAHLYLWTTNQFLEDAYFIARSWRFAPIKLLVWVKAPKGRGLGGTYASATEYVLFCRRGSLAALERVERNWWQWQRGAHSAKPEAFLDMVERVSPAPRLELFARRQRLGWDTWGNEALNHVTLENEPMEVLA